jgi:hypothetical protein
MLYKELETIVKWVEEYRKLPTVYSVKEESVETRDDRLKLALRLIRIIRWLKYEWAYININWEHVFNIWKYNQAIANCVSYYNKPTIIAWSFVKLLELIITDLNLQLPQRPNFKVLEELIKNKSESFDDFFDWKLTEAEKKHMWEKKWNGTITWLSDFDWKLMSFNLKLKDWSDILLSDRSQLMKLKNEDIIYILDNKLTDGSISEWAMFIYSNIEKISPRWRRAIYIALITSALFRQDYLKYPLLAKQHWTIKEIIEKA